MYTSHIHPHVLYCNFLLDGASKSVIYKIQIKQNAVLRAVRKVDYSVSTVKLLSDIGVDSTCMKKIICNFLYVYIPTVITLVIILHRSYQGDVEVMS